MTTAATVIDRTLRQLLSGTVEPRNQLTSGVDASATTLSFVYPLEGIRAGQVVEIDSELMYVWAANASDKTVTVQRAHNGTTAATHAANSVAKIHPRFPRAQVFEAINDEISDLSSPMHGLFQVKTINLDYNGSDTMIDLTGVTSIIDLLQVSVRYMVDDYPIARKVRIVRDMPTDDFPSGFALRFDQGVFPGRLRIVYKAPYSTATNETTDINTTCGIQESVTDIVALGAQIRLMSPREIRRNFTEAQSDTRRAEEVGAGAINNSYSGLLRLRRDRIQAEAAKLMRSYPTFLSKD